jgi:hypothetical protein
VQVDDHAQADIAAPLHKPIEKGPARSLETIYAVGAGLDKKPPIERHADGVEAGGLEKRDIVLGDINVAKLRPKACCLGRPNQGLDDSCNLFRAACSLELEHVAFGNQPVAEIDPFDGEIVALAIDKARPLSVDEVNRCGVSDAAADR